LAYLDIANLLTGVALIFSAIPPLIMTCRVKVKRIRNLTYLLSAFLLLHGAHHTVWYLGDIFLSHEILEPASVICMIVFGIYLYQTSFLGDEVGVSRVEPVPVVASAATIVVGSLMIDIGPNITAVALFISFTLFALMVYKHPSIRSLHFQFAIFLGVWAISEIIYAFEELSILTVPYPDMGLWFHFASMFALGLFVNYRIFGFWKRVKNIRIRQVE
jgi:phosphatidylserine synthase